jgi:hypothetical protein
MSEFLVGGGGDAARCQRNEVVGGCLMAGYWQSAQMADAPGFNVYPLEGGPRLSAPWPTDLMLWAPSGW